MLAWQLTDKKIKNKKFNGIVHPKILIKSSFTHPGIVLMPYRTTTKVDF